MSMRRSAAIVRCLVGDTFRQARAAGVFWLMLGVSIFCTGLCFTIRVTPDGALESAGGTWGLPDSGSVASAVHSLQAQLATWVADGAGLLLVLLWTAGLLPSFLQPDAVSLLLARPVARWQLLTGKFLGVLIFVAFQATVFIGSTWLALGVRTGVWSPDYFLSLPLLLLHFVVVFSFAAMLAVATRSTPACVFGALVFWLLCWAMNFGRYVPLLARELKELPPGFARLVETGYWVLPKPLDFHLLMEHVLGGGPLAPGLELSTLAAHGLWSPLASVLTSLLTALVLLVLASYDFLTAEY